MTIFINYYFLNKRRGELYEGGSAGVTDCDMKARERRKQEKPFEMA
jgi:hypothetical protein